MTVEKLTACLALSRFAKFGGHAARKKEGTSPFERRLQRAEFNHLVGSRATTQTMAESYTGPPM